MAPPVQPRSWDRVKLFLGRLALAHVVAYPLAFLCMCASMPVVIHVFIDAIEHLEGETTILDRLVIPVADINDARHRALRPRGTDRRPHPEAPMPPIRR